MSAAVPGLFVGLSLIVAIGAQNAYVLRQGLRREHVATVVAICAVSDALLIALGVAGVGTLVDQAPWLLVTLRWLGAAYLLAYGARSLWRARRPQSLSAAADDGSRRATVVGTTLALTYLNPHVYLDTVVMLGSVANQYGADRWWFAAGAAAASVLWFTGLGFGARAAAPVLSRPGTWRVLDLLIGVAMIALGVRLALG